ncbi:hypothetical protein K457DRAFT_140433 [Linnemannia elongata AG-77]|uniref:Uncharacterized protein n=1 Tax=Linnemannia elongata AG-77 TaxID=1314771 RepID=A0A197JNJ1_9FUNG|nr:hypothetical protein K457DRAFT_140433 [Linnemannia elongata AG-77]
MGGVRRYIFLPVLYAWVCVNGKVVSCIIFAVSKTRTRRKAMFRSAGKAKQGQR